MRPGFRVPPGWWVAIGVVAVHGAAFWFLADKHFLPRVKREAAPPPADFAARTKTVVVDPQSGETETVREYVVSTSLRSPSPSPAKSAR